MSTKYLKKNHTRNDCLIVQTIFLVPINREWGLILPGKVRYEVVRAGLYRPIATCVSVAW